MNRSNDITVTIDVAHPPRHPDEVERELVSAWQSVRDDPAIHLLKIVHGRSGTTKEVVRNWCFRNRKKFEAIINGEDFGVFDPTTQRLRHIVGTFPDVDLEQANDGMVVVWLK